MPLKVDWLKNDHELGEKVYIFFHFRQVGFGGLMEEGEIVIYGYSRVYAQKLHITFKKCHFHMAAR